MNRRQLHLSEAEAIRQGYLKKPEPQKIAPEPPRPPYDSTWYDELMAKLRARDAVSKEVKRP